MKKLLLSALACVAFAGSSFASNEVVEKETLESSPPCVIAIIVYSPDGELIELIGDKTFPEAGDPCLYYGYQLAEKVKRMYPDANLSVSIDTRY